MPLLQPEIHGLPRSGTPYRAHTRTVRLIAYTFSDQPYIFDCILVNYPCSCILTALFTAVKQNVCMHKWQRFKFQLCLSKIALSCFCTYAILPSFTEGKTDGMNLAGNSCGLKKRQAKVLLSGFIMYQGTSKMCIRKAAKKVFFI